MRGRDQGPLPHRLCRIIPRCHRRFSARAQILTPHRVHSTFVPVAARKARKGCGTEARAVDTTHVGWKTEPVMDDRDLASIPWSRPGTDLRLRRHGPRKARFFLIRPRGNAGDSSFFAGCGIPPGSGAKPSAWPAHGCRDPTERRCPPAARSRRRAGIRARRAG